MYAFIFSMIDYLYIIMRARLSFSSMHPLVHHLRALTTRTTTILKKDEML